MKMSFSNVRSAALAFLAFALVSTVSAQVMLIPRGSTWKYHNLGTDLGTAWRTAGYDDSAWAGPSAGPLGDNVEGVQQCATVINIGPGGSRFPTVYYRKTITVTNAEVFVSLILRLQRDDGAAIYLNGTLLQADGVAIPSSFAAVATQTIAGADETTYYQYIVPATHLVNGDNVFQVENKQVVASSSDLQFDLEVEGQADLEPPVILVTAPPQSTTVLSLTSVEVIFNEAVRGVNASDLLINTIPASSVTSNNPNDFTFFFPQPATGVVQVAFASGHDITDASAGTNAFAGANWTYVLDTNASTAANVVISEFLADNNNGAKDDDGTRQDWIELFNQGPLGANLQGWFLTDETNNLTKWRFPSVNLAANNWLLIWASSKDRTNPAAPLHTNFKIAKNAGSFLALVDPNTNVVSSFSNYVVQLTDVSYGRDQLDPNQYGYLTPPTPGAANSRSGPGFLGPPVASVASGVYTNASITLALSNTNGLGTIRYTTDATPPTSNSTVYSSPIVLANNSTIKARIFPPAGTNLLPSDVMVRNFVFLDTTATNFTSKLPTMIISTEGRGIPANVPPGQPRARGSIVIIDTQNGRSSIQAEPDVQEVAAFEIFGQTSAGFPKLPIRVEIQDGVGNDRDVEVLGMPADSDWRLRNPYNDKTEMNDFLGYELWEKMGHYSVRRKFVEVFVDTGGGRVTYPGDYYGIMVLCETIKVNKDRVDIPRLSPYSTNLTATSGGFIFKRDKVSPGDLDFNTSGGPGFSAIPLKLHEPKPNDLRLPAFHGVSASFPGAGYTTTGTNQMTYLRNFLGTMERMLYTNDWTTRTGTNHYSYYLDPIAFADQMIHVELTKQIDGYRLSDYFNKGNDGRIGPGPVWDWNLAFGNADYAQGGLTNTWYYEITGEADHPWARRLITGTSSSTTTTGDPNFVQLIADRWAMFRTNVLNGTNLLQRIDEIAILLQESAARDLYGKYRGSPFPPLIGAYTWPNPSGVSDGRDVDFVHPTNYFGPLETVAPTNQNGSIIGQMKKWMLGRYLWMDSQFTKVPTFSATDGLVTNGFQVTVTPPAGATLYYRLDGVDPRAAGGSIVAGTLSNNGPVTVTINANSRIVARAKAAVAWKSTFSGPNAVSLYSTVPSLRITEIMYHPASLPGDAYPADDYEYIEVKNVGVSSLNVNGYSLSGGVQFTFPNVTLTAGQSAVIVANIVAFQSRYGVGPLILGAYTGRLSNAGDHVVLSGGLLESILDFSYADNWYPATDGSGFSLVVVDENAAAGAWNSSSNWRPSTAPGGSPSNNDPAAPVIPFVVVNEALTHGDIAAGDVIELRNMAGTPADVGGWFLTDNFNQPKKFVIPPGTIIPGNDFVLFYETNSFGATNIYTANGTNSFGLGSNGDDLYLFSGNGTNLTGYAHGFDFGASASNVTFGRYVISTGNDHFVAQSANTLNGANASPLVGPVVIDEIQYHPPDVGISGIGFNDTENEFIALRNLSGTPVPLYDPAHTTNTWHLRGAVDYNFPSGVTLPANGYLFLVGFDPVLYPGTLAAFRNNNLVPTNVPIYGPWSGNLDNNSGNVELNRPGVPDTNDVPYILVERVGYSDSAPWPPGADGFGLSLQRIVGGSYANDPTNWAAAAPTPGSSFVGGGTAPAITSQPGPQSNIFGANLVLSATATGTAPLRFQWRFNGFNLPGATNSTLTISNFQSSHVGTYNVFVFNSAGSAVGTNFSVSGRVQLAITLQPVDSSSLAGQTNTFQVGAVGTGVLRYQWRRNGINLLNATNSIFSVTNSQLANEGLYTCLVSDDFDSLLSNPASLTIIARPTYTLHPISQTVVQGGTVSLSVQASGTTPMSFRWRSNAVTFVPAIPPFTSNTVYFENGYILNGLSNTTLVLTNVGTNYNGAPFSAVITNLAGSASGIRVATLVVLADTDQDGLPDSWENGRPGFSINDPADGVRDDDGDGMTNAEEYFAGTDPFSALSYLKVNLPLLGPAQILFNAISNRTYTVEFTDGLIVPSWQKLGDVLARTNNRPEVLIDPSGNSNRFYRLVIPLHP